jgi:hypothetical protein
MRVCKCLTAKASDFKTASIYYPDANSLASIPRLLPPGNRPEAMGFRSPPVVGDTLIDPGTSQDSMNRTALPTPSSASIAAPISAARARIWVLDTASSIAAARASTVSFFCKTGAGVYSYALPLAGGDLALLRRPEVTLLNATGYAIALQTVFNDACPGGPFVDDFDDPESGWPRFDDKFTAGYVNGAYRIHLRQPGSWAAVTRGDYWRDSSEVQIRGGQPPNQDGTFGLIFGLDANWTDFYTAEVYPAASKWALFHFSGGQWQLLSLVDYQYPSATGSTIRIRRNPLNGETKLDVDGHVSVTLPSFTGRVGLMASAFGTPVTATFDDYRFVGANCDGPPGEARDARVTTGDQPPVSWSSTSSSVLWERPPLAELFEQ